MLSRFHLEPAYTMRAQVGSLLTTTLVLVAIVSHNPEMEAADRGYSHLKLLRFIPQTVREIEDAHEKARSQTCEPVPAEEPLEISGFMPCLTSRDRAELERGVLLWPSSRRHVFTIGLDMLSADKARLPTVSGGQILRYLDNHYVTVQARIQKDPLTSELFLHHRPLAATATFGRGTLTQDFTEATLEAVREFHSLGLYLPSGQSAKAKNLRTLVLTYRSMEVLPAGANGKPRLQPKFEYVFMRARDSKDSTPALTVYAFATSDQRTRLHFLPAWTAPHQPQQCLVHAKVIFTEFSTLGLIPTKSATRNVVYNSKAVFEWEDLNDYARAQNWNGSALDNLNETLDAIIDGRVTPQPAGGP